MPRWTPEARERQAALIREWKPWERSTGPVTSRGKRKASKNWSKGGRRVSQEGGGIGERLVPQLPAALALFGRSGGLTFYRQLSLAARCLQSTNQPVAPPRLMS